MTIRDNLSALNLYSNLLKNSNDVKKSSEKLASGSRINRAADDASGLSISEKMQSQLSGLSSSISNVNSGISMLQTAEGALGSTTSSLGRLNEIAVAASNGIYTDEERGYFQMEANQILSEINRVASATDFNGTKVLDGSLDNDSFLLQVGIDNASEQQLDVNIGAMDSASLGVSGFDVTTASGALNSVGSVSSAIETVSSQRSSIGANQNQLEHTLNSLTVAHENLTAAESTIRDTDMAGEMISYTKSRLLQQFGLALMAQATQENQGLKQLITG